MKLRFLVGVARRIAEINGTLGFPQVRETLGALAAEVGMVEAMEVRGGMAGEYYVPHRHTLYAAQVITQKLYGRVIATGIPLLHPLTGTAPRTAARNHADWDTVINRARSMRRARRVRTPEAAGNR